MSTIATDSATGFAWSEDQRGTSGLTKREYFAAMAMQGLCVEGAFSKGVHQQAESVGATSSEAIATYAVDIADELIKQLNRPAP